MKKLKLGLVNIMPNARDYARMIHRALEAESGLVEIHPIRLRTHGYRSSVSEAASYPCFRDLVQRVQLDLLLVTGAPVEHLPFDQIHYWDELNGILDYAKESLTSVFGICFGGLAVAKHLGIDKRVFPDKIFGVHDVAASPEAERYLGADCKRFNLALSTWALLNEDQIARSRYGPLKPLVHHPALGHLMLSTADDKFVMLFGHPEYSVDSLFQEWQRDLKKDISYTRHFNHSSFLEMERQLKTGASPILSNWVRSHIKPSALSA